MPQLAEVVRFTKRTSTVPFSEIEPLISQAIQATGSTQTEILRAIGYESSSAITPWREKGAAPTKVKYALLGLLSELRVERPAERQFSYDDLLTILTALAADTSNPRNRTLLRIVAKQIAFYD